MTMILINILDASGVDVQRSRSKDYEVTIDCPFCADTRKRLGINVKTGQAHCYNCSWKSGGTSRTARELCRVFKLGTGFRYREKTVEKQDAPRLEAIGYVPEYEPFSNDGDYIQKKARKYLNNRGVSLLQIVKHRIGYAAVGNMAWRILFPVLGKDGKIYGTVARDFSGMQRKYLNTSGIKLLWGAHQEAHTAVVVEGVLDALRVEQALLSKGSMVAIARLGSTITQLQLMQLKDYEKVIIIPDNDQPGVDGAIALAEACIDYRIDTSISIPNVMDRRDPGDMQEEEILDRLGNAKPWNKATELRMRLSKQKYEDHTNARFRQQYEYIPSY